MEHYLTVHSPHDRLPLDVVETIPEGEVKGIVLIVHGMQEHKERYLKFMDFLARRGYACIAHDHRGHGKSVRDPDDLGYFYDDSARAIVEDLQIVLDTLRLQYPHVPVFMIAHSMGTLIARCFLRQHDDEFSGVILSGPVYENPKAKAGQKLIDLLTRFSGGRHISTRVAKMVEGSFDRSIPGTQTNRWLNSNADAVEEFNRDPLCGKPFTLNGYRNLMKLVQKAYNPDGWKVSRPQLPILFAAGQEDPVIGSPQEFEMMQEFLRRLGYQRVRGKLYPGMRHELLNETDRRHVYEDFYNFLEIAGKEKTNE